MSSKTDEWYTVERAESLAVVLLTRRNDVVVDRAKRLTDLVVRLLVKGQDTGRVFGVQTKGLLERIPLRGNNGSVSLRFRPSELERFHDAPFPICLFGFDVIHDIGYYRWIREPILGGRTARTLRFNRGPQMMPLDDEAVGEIIKRVHQWYDAEAQHRVA